MDKAPIEGKQIDCEGCKRNYGSERDGPCRACLRHFHHSDFYQKSDESDE